jgi:hypothetical protein
MSIHSLDQEPVFPNHRMRHSDSYMSHVNNDETVIDSPEMPSPSTHDIGCKYFVFLNFGSMRYLTYFGYFQLSILTIVT